MRPLTQRQEAFCQAYILFPNGATAARTAGYAPKSARSQASRLLARPAVAARLRSLRREMVDSNCRRRDDLVAKLEVIYRRALDDHQFMAAMRAVQMQARLAGHLDPVQSDAGQSSGPENATNDDKPQRFSPNTVEIQ